MRFREQRRKFCPKGPGKAYFAAQIGQDLRRRPRSDPVSVCTGRMSWLGLQRLKRSVSADTPLQRPPSGRGGCLLVQVFRFAAFSRKTDSAPQSCLIARSPSGGLRRPSLCAPYSNRGNRLVCHPEAQTARLLAVRNPNKSQVFPAKEPNGSRILPDRFSLPFGKAYNASGSSNHVPERTPDQQR